MEQISSRTLMILLISAIVVSVGGTIISLSKINQLSVQIPRITGMATSGTGYVNVTIASIASISVIEGQIDFGSCSPNASIGANLSSNVSNGSTWESWGAPGVCSSFPNSPDNITIKNDGNAYVNVTVSTNTLASSLIGGTAPYPPQFLFSTRNASDGTCGGTTCSGGCFNRTTGARCINVDTNISGLQWGWKNFSDTSAFCACDNLSFGTKNAIYLFAKLDLPADAPEQGEKTATLTLTANEIT